MENDENHAESSRNYDARTMSINEITKLEERVANAFKQGDLIGYRQYIKDLRELKQTIDEGVQQAESVEVVQQNSEVEFTGRGLFPTGAPQSLKDYTNSLSIKEHMILFTAVSVQRLIANSYQDSNGHWNIRHPGDSGYVDIFKQPDFSYTKLVEDMLGYLQFERTYLSVDDFKAKEDVLNGFKNAVEGY